jgi:HEPN domain-containing protein
MDNTKEATRWFKIADEDMALAEHAATTMHPTPDELICFHCQQCVEKYLKGFLVFHGEEPPKIHDLERVEKLCEAVDTSFSLLVTKATILSQYGVMPRYPNELQISADDVKIALCYAKDIRQFVRERL